MNFLKLTHDTLDLNQIADLIYHESCGGVAFFVGTTRDFFENKKVICLEYEAYEQMALKSMTKICDELRTIWSDIKHIAIYHRLGTVPIKEASVIIGISSPHRKTCLDAVQMAIDHLKMSVPIWKKEKYSDEEDNHSAVDNNPLMPASKKMKLLRPDFFDKCPVQEIPIVKSLIQIHADESEVRRRVNCFVERKREDIGLNNIKDFIEIKSNDDANDESSSSCARVNSSIYRLKNSNNLFEVHRVKNEYGPQTKNNYINTYDKLMENQSPTKIKQEPGDSIKTPSGIKERLENAETFLNLKMETNQNLYKRLKAIEDRILYLETLSPEYNHFLQKGTESKEYKGSNKKIFSIDELNDYIKDLQE